MPGAGGRGLGCGQRPPQDRYESSQTMMIKRWPSHIPHLPHHKITIYGWSTRPGRISVKPSLIEIVKESLTSAMIRMDHDLVASDYRNTLRAHASALSNL